MLSAYELFLFQFFPILLIQTRWDEVFVGEEQYTKCEKFVPNKII